MPITHCWCQPYQNQAHSPTFHLAPIACTLIWAVCQCWGHLATQMLFNQTWIVCTATFKMAIITPPALFHQPHSSCTTAPDSRTDDSNLFMASHCLPDPHVTRPSVGCIDCIRLGSLLNTILSTMVWLKLSDIFSQGSVSHWTPVPWNIILPSTRQTLSKYCQEKSMAEKR